MTAQLWRVSRGLPLLAVAMLAACESSTAPSTALDPKAALADYQAMDTVFASKAWASFKSLGGRSPMSSRAGIAAVASLSTNSGPVNARAFAVQLVQSLRSSTTDARASETLISVVHRGKTLTYDAASDQYVINATRSGAPSNGTRFVLYDVDAGGKPIASQEVGYADLLDNGTAGNATLALRLLGVVRGKTTVDYQLRVDPRNGGGTVDVTGFVLGDNGAKLEFTIGVVGATTNGKSTIDAEFSMGIPQREFEVSGRVTGVDGNPNGDGTVDLSVQHGAHTFDVQMQNTSGTLDGAITLDGVRFVSVSGPPVSPTLRNDAGQPLNGTELLLVLHIVDATDAVFDMVQDLMRPVDNLLVLGWLL